MSRHFIIREPGPNRMSDFGDFEMRQVFDDNVEWRPREVLFPDLGTDSGGKVGNHVREGLPLGQSDPDYPCEFFSRRDTKSLRNFLRRLDRLHCYELETCAVACDGK